MSENSILGDMGGKDSIGRDMTRKDLRGGCEDIKRKRVW